MTHHGVTFSRVHSLRSLLAAAVCVTAAAGFGACGSDPPGGDGSSCEPGDPASGRSCECTGNECICPSNGDCAIYCVDQCDLQCAGSGSCDFLCEDACDVSCTGSGNCGVEVDQGSTVTCSGSGDCYVLCHGDCTMACPGSATCTVTCAPNAECNITINSCSGEVTECPDSTSVCNGGCP